MDTPLSKEDFLKQVDGLRDLSRRTRHLVSGMTQESDKQCLERHAAELDSRAKRLELQAVDAKAGVFSRSKILNPGRFSS